VIGTELGGALKNIVAIAAGAAAGLDLGANAIAAIMTRGLAEMTRLGVALGADPSTFQGLAGIGDLAATCYSPLSRNHRLGELLARGMTSAGALAEIAETVEGAATTPVALELARRVGVELPIAEQVAAVLDGTATVGEAMVSLLSRHSKRTRTPGAVVRSFDAQATARELESLMTELASGARPSVASLALLSDLSPDEARALEGGWSASRRLHGRLCWTRPSVSPRATYAWTSGAWPRLG
jgi:hypothetical protein